MKRKFYSFLSICLGGGVTALSFLFKDLLNDWFYLVFALGIICLVASIFEFHSLFKKPKRDKFRDFSTPEQKEPPEYRRKKSLMTGAEIKLYKTLTELFNEKYLIIPQPALHTVIDKLTQNAYRNELFRVCDFLLADKETFSPLLLIELNDSSHNRLDRIERDQKVEQICQSAKMPLLTISTRDLSDKAHIKKSVQKNALRR